ncbi:hemolysin family protein [Aquibacillus koreensis]|uniref:Hemolysin family protein n=1 Tax=Aquibacillus koreensis TaxID=279446 RepID=A0A9X3WSG5_9BACI|nr:hemolysin family protein [Aquibacillus koreensis]MCT2534202.1 hemolysin family protein [Aquibacillus koreensis]MDC3422594.1 hemolysin family protein [Aquibacillus koreensis]
MSTAIIILVILIIVNAFFAASEIALVSLNDNKVKKMADQGDKKAIKLLHLLSSPGRFLATIQIGITLAGFLASAFAADYFSEPLSSALYNLGVPLSLAMLKTVSVITITILLSYFTLVIGELVPKQLALQKPEMIANFAVIPLTILFKVSYPFVAILNFSTNAIVRLFGVDPNAENEEATEEEIRMMVDVGGERGTIDTSEKLMINNIFEFNDKVVSDIMTHRTDMAVLSIEANLQEIVNLVSLKRYTRFPVYEESIDKIIGVLHSKDLIQFIEDGTQENFNLRDMLRDPYFVLETQSIDMVFQEMKKNNIHIAIVLDEYGGTDGMITIEDIIEEIVGEIRSEHDYTNVEEEEINEISPHHYLVSGTAHLYQVEDKIGVELPSDEYDTLNGFLVGQLGYIPKKEEQLTISYKNLTFEVSKISEKRIEEVYITVG